MKAVFVLAVLFGIAFTLTQGAALKPKQPRSLTQCQEKTVEKLVNKFIDETFAIRTDVYKAYKAAYSGVIECVISSFTTLTTCVEGVLETQVAALEADLEDYVSEVKTFGSNLAADIDACL